MTNTSVQRETITRKALRLYEERTIEPLGHGRYSVEGSDGFYEVDLKPFGGEESCPCPATKPCYHIALATIYRAKITTRRRAEARRPEGGPRGHTSQPRAPGRRSCLGRYWRGCSSRPRLTSSSTSSPVGRP